MASQLQELSAVKATQEKVLSKQERIVLHSTQQFKQTARLRQDLRKATWTNRTEHVNTRRKIADGNRRVIDTISSQLDEIRISIPQAPRVTKKSNRKIRFIGPCREAVLTPLLLIKHQVRRAVLHGLSQNTKGFSPEHLYWLQTEFDKLVSSATQEAAAFCEGSTATSFDHWDYHVGLDPLLDTETVSSADVTGDDDEKDSYIRTEVALQGIARQRRTFAAYETLSFNSPIGILHLEIPRASSATALARDTAEVRLSFIASPRVPSYSIKAHFVKAMHRNVEPRLYTQLNAFRVSEYTDIYWNLFEKGTLEDIDAAFRNGTISPYDQSGYGDSICVWVSF
jgi:hypothetical protein